MNPEIDRLIKIAITDGEISVKERGVILRKAESLGLDKDEVEMILDGELALMKKEQEQKENQIQPKSNKDGELKKCPSCGAPVSSFTTKCTDCGHEFIGRDASGIIQKLFDLLTKAEEEELNRPRPSNGFLRGFTDTQIPQAVANRSANIINNYPIPITKSDILEFLAQAVSKCKKLPTIGFNVTLANFAHNIKADAWRNKCEEVILKARFSMKDDKKTLEEIELYAKQLKIK